LAFFVYAQFSRLGSGEQGLNRLKRRNFVAVLGGALAWSPGVRAQVPAVPVIGFLNSGSAQAFERHLEAFRQGLKEAGYVEGRNVEIAYRWADGQVARLPELAADLVRRRVSLIVATGGSLTAHPAKNATATIPILFIAGPDPVGDGLVQSLNRPGGNATGMAMMTSHLMPKRVEFLLDLVPNAAKIALLLNSGGVGADAVEKDVETAIHAFGRQMILLKVSTNSDLEAAFVSAARQRADALLVSPNSLFTNWRAQIVALAARHALPASYAWREFPDAGGLISYGPSVVLAYHQIGQYAGRILKGDKPADLPVQQPVKFDLVINLRTARALGLNVPTNLLVFSTEVIE
jgi:putative ABC transport system substrate-binding protein